MLTVAELQKPIEQVPVQAQVSEKREAVNLNEHRVFPELHLTGGGTSTGNLWYLDNGASNHMTGELNKFKELDHGVVGRVRFGDGSAVEIMGKGSVLFQCKTSNDQWLLRDVYYIPKLKSNLVSLGQLTEIGYKVTLDEDCLEVLDKMSGRLLMKVQRSVNRMYKIHLKLAEPVCLMGSLEEPAWCGMLGWVMSTSGQ